MVITIREQYSLILKNTADEIDISPTEYKDAVERYLAVGKWLEGGDFDGIDKAPEISPQGSFRLGTVTKPVRQDKNGEIDIDLVFEVPLTKDRIQPDRLKAAVGDRLRAHKTYEKMLEKEGKRCWTLKYAGNGNVGFHMDILPSIQESVELKKQLLECGVPHSLSELAISITHKNENHYKWLSSNPRGYAQWFDEIKKPIFQEISERQKQIILEKNYEVFANIEDVPDTLVKTPLQRAIQILKRHRDIRFLNHEWDNDKPISMIITTLSARLYQQEEDVLTTLENIIKQLSSYSVLFESEFLKTYIPKSHHFIQRKSNGEWYIPNPVNPNENFADRWHENDNRKAKAFFEWLNWVKTDLIQILDLANLDNITKSMKHQFGETLIEKASQNILVIASPAILTGRKDDYPKVEISNPSKPYKKYE